MTLNLSLTISFNNELIALCSVYCRGGLRGVESLGGETTEIMEESLGKSTTSVTENQSQSRSWVQQKTGLDSRPFVTPIQKTKKQTLPFCFLLN